MPDLGLAQSPLDALRAALAVAMEPSPPSFANEFAALEKQTKALRNWLGARGVAKPPQDASREALREFVRARRLPTLKIATLSSFGCAEPFDDRRHGLIGDLELFPEFLRRVDDWLENPRALRLCYRGLLHSYFHYDVEKDGPPLARDNWERLRSYLGERSELIATPGFEPPWVDALRRNREILGEDPGVVYGSELLKGRAERFEEVRAQLPVTEGSWFVWRVVVGQISAATGFKDDEFRSSLSRLLDLLENTPAAKTFGLARLLTRYRQCASPTLHERLRDFAVEAWGNPWLALNEAAWSLVGPDARAMVTDWLKLALMQNFFGLLAKDGVNDTRRLRFWQTYRDSIHAMYFALGETARANSGPDYREVRKQMDGLRLTLTNSNDDNNAFIMCMKKHVIVEFGEKGNACYIFERERLPFPLTGAVAGNHLALKHDSRVERLTHTDSGRQSWEDKFRSILADLVGVRMAGSGQQPQRTFSPSGRPDTPRQASPQIVQSPNTRGFQESSSRYPATPKPAFAMDAFEQFCMARNLRWADHRSKGGNLWVYTRQQDSELGAQLTAWGFRYKNPQGWWLQ